MSHSVNGNKFRRVVEKKDCIETAINLLNYYLIDDWKTVSNSQGWKFLKRHFSPVLLHITCTRNSTRELQLTLLSKIGFFSNFATWLINYTRMRTKVFLLTKFWWVLLKSCWKKKVFVLQHNYLPDVTSTSNWLVALKLNTTNFLYRRSRSSGNLSNKIEGPVYGFGLASTGRFILYVSVTLLTNLSVGPFSTNSSYTVTPAHYLKKRVSNVRPIKLNQPTPRRSTRPIGCRSKNKWVYSFVVWQHILYTTQYL